MDHYHTAASEVIERCELLASHSEEPDQLKRTFLCPPMHAVHTDVRRWMERAGMIVHVDPAGNIRGRYPGVSPDQPALMIGSHLDTVPDAGMFDGPLGVLLGIGLVELLGGRRLPFPVEVIGFSEEEGVRFNVPLLGSRALTGELDDALLALRDAQGISIRDAIENFGLDPSRVADAAVSPSPACYLEFHIEQGPALDTLRLPLGIVETIVGQTRAELQFHGQANHAGTTPMHLRRDALAGAAEWIGVVEREAIATKDLVATVGRADVKPGAGNIVPGSVTVSLDVRHPQDQERRAAVDRLVGCAGQIAARRGLTITSVLHVDQPAVDMDTDLITRLATAVERCGLPVHFMNSGAGHDAMVMARRAPAVMLFLRSPGGISHHPDESVLVEDVAAALAAGFAFMERFHG